MPLSNLILKLLNPITTTTITTINPKLISSTSSSRTISSTRNLINIPQKFAGFARTGSGGVKRRNPGVKSRWKLKQEKRIPTYSNVGAVKRQRIADENNGGNDGGEGGYVKPSIKAINDSIKSNRRDLINPITGKVYNTFNSGPLPPPTLASPSLPGLGSKSNTPGTSIKKLPGGRKIWLSRQRTDRFVKEVRKNRMENLRKSGRGNNSLVGVGVQDDVKPENEGSGHRMRQNRDFFDLEKKGGPDPVVVLPKPVGKSNAVKSQRDLKAVKLERMVREGLLDLKLDLGSEKQEDDEDQELEQEHEELPIPPPSRSRSQLSPPPPPQQSKPHHLPPSPPQINTLNPTALMPFTHLITRASFKLQSIENLAFSKNALLGDRVRLTKSNISSGESLGYSLDRFKPKDSYQSTSFSKNQATSKAQNTPLLILDLGSSPGGWTDYLLWRFSNLPPPPTQKSTRKSLTKKEKVELYKILPGENRGLLVSCDLIPTTLPPNYRGDLMSDGSVGAGTKGSSKDVWRFVRGDFMDDYVRGRILEEGREMVGFWMDRKKEAMVKMGKVKNWITDDIVVSLTSDQPTTATTTTTTQQQKSRIQQSDKIFDIILSDMAANTSGDRPSDVTNTNNLLLQTLQFSTMHLKPGGTLIGKFFSGGNYNNNGDKDGDDYDDEDETDDVVKVFKKKGLFDRVQVVKPEGSRGVSKEMFVVGVGFRGIGIGGD